MKQLLASILLLLLLHTAYGQALTIPQLRRELAQARHDTVRLRLYSELASLYSKSDPPSDSTYTLAMRGIALARQQGMVVRESELYLHLGYYYKRLSQYPKAQAAYQTGLQIGQKAGVSTIRCRLLHRLAAVYGDQGMYQKTIETALASLQVAEQLRDSLLMCHVMQLLAAAHMDVQNSTAALLYAKKLNQLAKQVAAKHPDQRDLVLTGEETLAELYERNGQYSRAYPYLKQALAYYVAQHDESQITAAAVHVGNNLIKQKQPLTAISHISESLRQKLIPYPVSDTYEIYALAHQQLGQSDTALVYAQKAYKAALKKGHLKQTQSTLSTLISIEESQKLYPTALAHLRQLNAINDSLFTIQKTETIAQVEAKYQVTQKEQTIELLQKDAALRQITLARNQEELALRQRNQVFMVVFMLILMGMAGGLYVVFRRERFTNRLLATQKAEIQNKAEQLQQANQLKDKLFSIVGHDLRSPIAALRTQLQTVTTLAGTMSPKPGLQFGRLLQLADSAYSTVDNLLNWSLLQQNGIKTRPTAIDLAEIAEMILPLYQADVEAKQLVVETDLAPARAQADEYHLEIITRNIVHNAIKFTPPGGWIRITTRLGTDHHLAGASRAMIMIQDSGIGISSDVLATQQRPVSRVGTNGERGTGLGLDVCRELIRLNNGQMNIESALGQGTTVTVCV